MIKADNLSFNYRGSHSPAAKNLTFEICQGEIFGFLGPSGAGKSTTQKILIGLLKGYSGRVSIKDTDLVRWDAELYNHIGVGFELPNHYLKLTALENLEFFGSFYRYTTDFEELLEMVGLLEDAGKKVEDYSKGMKVRLNFVRSLMHDPEILFLDEPTSGLDPVNARKIKDIILARKASGKTIFMTTHNMHDADELCDRISFIVDGKIMVTDTPKNLKLEYGRSRVRIEYADGDEPSRYRKQEFPLKGLGQDQTFMEIMKSREIISIHSQEASLDEVFIQVTGRHLI
jgi:fluoroquinolone transport system ATP-binding protein